MASAEPVDVVLRRLPAGHRDAHRGATCHTVPPSQHVPSRWTPSMTARVRASPAVPSSVVRAAVEPDEDLVEDDLVEDPDPGCPPEALRHPTRKGAVALDEVDQARTGPSTGARPGP